MKLLVVEDDENSRVLLHTLLEAEGYQVVTAENGQDAVEQVRAGVPDLIISDIMMPKMDGYALCRALKRDPELGRIPFIFYSATYTSEADQQLALDLGADLFLVKPMEGGTLLGNIRDLLARGVAAYPPVSHPLDIDSRYAGVIARKLEKKLGELKDTQSALASAQRRAQQFMDSSEDMVFIKDTALCYVYVNTALARFFGRAPADLVGCNDAVLVSGEVAQRWEQSDRQALAGQQVVIDVERLGERLYETRRFPVPLKDGRTGVGGIIRDTTETQRAMQALHQSEERFRQVVENAGAWVWEMDAEGRYTYCSPVVTEILGYLPAELVGRMCFYELFPPETRDVVRQAAAARSAQCEGFRHLVNTVRHKDGHDVVLETSGSPILDDQGRVTGYRGVDVDITGRLRLEKSLQDQLDELRRWHVDTVDREMRILKLKQEVNELLARLGEPPRYTSVAEEPR